MTVSRPSVADIGAAAEHFGLHLDADVQRHYLTVVRHTLRSYDVVDALYDELRDPHFAAMPLLRRMVSAELLGRKSGKGFYDYH